MVSSVFDHVAREADALPSDEQLRLIARLAARPAENRPQWENFAGSVASPVCGEDAQEWITRTRQESDQQRAMR
jgi:hypothetical protein